MMKDQMSLQATSGVQQQTGRSEAAPVPTSLITTRTYGSTSSSLNVPAPDSSVASNGIAKNGLHRVEEVSRDFDGDDDDDDDDDDDMSSDDGDDDDDDDEEDSELSFDDYSIDEEQNLLHKNEIERREKSLKCEIFNPVLVPILQLYRLIRDAVILVTNTDDVWDSPAYENIIDRRNTSTQSLRGSFSSQSTRQQRQGNLWRTSDDFPSLNVDKSVSLRHKIGVLFWFLVLALFYALERCTWKIMADRMGPFRMVVGGEAVVVTHAFISGTWIIGRWLAGKSQRTTAMLPLADVFLMAVLDSIQLLLVAISSSHVAPILTAILVHVSIPFTTIINYIMRGRSTSASIPKENEEESVVEQKQNSQLFFGSTLIMLSSILALSPAITTLLVPTVFSSMDVMADRSAMNTILFVISYIPGAISQSFKERTLSAYAQPVDPDLLNAILSLFSAIFAIIASPIFYPLQGLADRPSTPEDNTNLEVKNWIHQYPSKEVSQNFNDGLLCIAGTLSNEQQIRGYPEEAHCDFAYGFVLLHVISIIVISHAVGKICSAGAFKIMHRGISVGIILSVISLFIYQVFVDDVDYGVLPNVFHISCAAVLVMGSEVYHKITLETHWETAYAPPVNFGEEEEEEEN